MAVATAATSAATATPDTAGGRRIGTAGGGGKGG